MFGVITKQQVCFFQSQLRQIQQSLANIILNNLIYRQKLWIRGHAEA
jgi:hypothetical protein